MKHVTLETAKKLKEKGWNQSKTLFTYLNGIIVDSLTLSGLTHEQMPKDPEFVAAPDISELLDALPPYVELHKNDDGSYSAYLDPQEPIDVQEGNYSNQFDADTPAEALAALWLALREKGIV